MLDFTEITNYPPSSSLKKGNCMVAALLSPPKPGHRSQLPPCSVISPHRFLFFVLRACFPLTYKPANAPTNPT